MAAATKPRTLVIVGTFLRFVFAATLIVTSSLFGVAVAQAHTDLNFSTPEDGEQLDVAPTEVRLTFNEELFSELVEVSVLDSDGNLVMATEAEQTPPPGTDVIVPWPSDLPPGEYSVAYRVVSEDGHPVTGQITFSFAESAAAATPSEPTESEVPTEPVESAASDTPEPTTSVESIEPTPSGETAAAAAEAGEPDSSLVGPLLIGGAIVVGIGVVVSIVMLARSRQ